MSTHWQESKIAIQKNRILLLKLALLCTTELQPCEGENRGGQSDITQTHTHTHKKKKNKNHWWVKWEKELGVSPRGLKTKGSYNECPHRALNRTSPLLLSYFCSLLSSSSTGSCSSFSYSLFLLAQGTKTSSWIVVELFNLFLNCLARAQPCTVTTCAILVVWSSVKLRPSSPSTLLCGTSLQAAYYDPYFSSHSSGQTNYDVSKGGSQVVLGI